MHSFIGAGLKDPKIFARLAEEEEQQRKRDAFKLELLQGPINLLSFKYDDARYFLFGEDHVNVPKFDGETRYLKITGDDSIEFGGTSSDTMYITRFFYALISRPESFNLFLEIVPRGSTNTFVAYDGYVAPTDIGEKHLESLFFLFQAWFEQGNNLVLGMNGFHVHGVDYRSHILSYGIGSQPSDYLTHWTLYYRLYEAEEDAIIAQLFPESENKGWDVKLLEMTLFEFQSTAFRRYCDAFKKRFFTVFHKYPNVRALKEFAELPAFLIRNTHQAVYFFKLPDEIQKVIRDQCLFRCPTIVATDRERRLALIGQMDAWYMDVPAMCVMLDRGQNVKMNFGFFGANHVDNFVAMAAALDKHFSVVTGLPESLDVPFELQDELTL